MSYIDVLQKQMEEDLEEIGTKLKELKIKEPKIKRTPINWIPKVGEKFYVIVQGRGVEELLINDYEVFEDIEPWNEKFFKYEAEAEKQLEINEKTFEINQRINELNDGWEPIFGKNIAYYLHLNYKHEKILSDGTYIFLGSNNLNYIKCEGIANKIKEEFEYDIIEIFKWEARIDD